jgi:hypothetical protein
VKRTLHLRLRVRKIEEAPDGQHVHIDAELQAQQTMEPNQKERIVKIGLPDDEEKIAKEFAEHAVGSFQTMLQKQGFVPMVQKPIAAIICLYITREHFNYLGRPTVDDYIELNARTDRGH